jgi:hypothetical protein
VKTLETKELQPGEIPSEISLQIGVPFTMPSAAGRREYMERSSMTGPALIRRENHASLYPLGQSDSFRPITNPMEPRSTIGWGTVTTDWRISIELTRMLAPEDRANLGLRELSDSELRLLRFEKMT